MKNHIYILLFLILSSGCQINTTKEEIDKYRTIKTEPIDISIGEKFALLIDSSGYMGDKVTFPTGYVASEIFIGEPNNAWNVEIVSSQLNVEWRDMFPLPIWHYSANYYISCLLTGPQIKLPLASNRTTNNGKNFIQPTTQSICSALDDIAGQARTYMQLTNKNESE